MKSKRNGQILKKDNNGFSIVMVIIAIAFVSILGIIVLWIALQNLWTKKVTLDSDKNFYTAETALDEIRTGLQKNVSAAAGNAYIYVMQHYSETMGSNSTRNWYFETKYVDSLKAQLQASGNPEQYNLDLLKNYLVTTASNGTTGAALTTTTAGPALTTSYSDGVTLKNLTVTYTDSSGYVSVITTDINVAIPDLNFTQSSNMPDVLQYCVIANNKLIVLSDATISTATGSVYAGKDGIELNGNSDFKITSNGGRIVSAGPVILSAKAVMQTEGTGAFWAKSFELKGNESKLSLGTNSFVADDLSINGDGCSVVLGSRNNKGVMTGSYCGFQNPASVKASLPYNDTTGSYIDKNDVSANESAYSSAIIVNGRNAALDMSNLTSLTLAGSSYVSTRIAKQIGNTNNSTLSDVLMGESLTVKSGQLAYLAPADCIQLTVDGTASKNSKGNPVLLAKGSTVPVVSLDVASTVASLNGKTLRDFGLGVSDIKTIYYPDGDNVLLYVYLNFKSTSDAADYFQAYYKTNKDYLNTYYKLYLQKIELNSSDSSYTTFTTNGNILTDNSLVNKTVKDTTGIIDEEAQYQNIFYALSKKLINSYSDLTTTEKSASNWVFENIMKKDTSGTKYLISSYLASNQVQTFKTIAAQSGGTQLEAKIINGDYTVTAADSNVRLVAATGNITINDGVSFKGTIIAGGIITIGKNVNIQSAPSEVATVYQCSYGADGKEVIDNDGSITGTKGLSISPMDFFINGSNYLFSGSTTGTATSGTVSKELNYSKLINYNNWKKQ